MQGRERERWEKRQKEENEREKEEDDVEKLFPRSFQALCIQLIKCQ